MFPYTLLPGSLAALTLFPVSRPASWVISGNSEARAQCYCHALIFDKMPSKPTVSSDSVSLESYMSQPLKIHPVTDAITWLNCTLWSGTLEHKYLGKMV